MSSVRKGRRSAGVIEDDDDLKSSQQPRLPLRRSESQQSLFSFFTNSVDASDITVRASDITVRASGSSCSRMTFKRRLPRQAEQTVTDLALPAKPKVASASAHCYQFEMNDCNVESFVERHRATAEITSGTSTIARDASSIMLDCASTPAEGGLAKATTTTTAVGQGAEPESFTSRARALNDAAEMDSSLSKNSAMATATVEEVCECFVTVGAENNNREQFADEEQPSSPTTSIHGVEKGSNKWTSSTYREMMQERGLFQQRQLKDFWSEDSDGEFTSMSLAELGILGCMGGLLIALLGAIAVVSLIWQRMI